MELERVAMGEHGFHFEARIGDSVGVMETVEFPLTSHPNRASVYVYLEDVDAAYCRAIACGAESLAEPQNKPYNERNAGVRDSFGNTWWMSTFKG